MRYSEIRDTAILVNRRTRSAVRLSPSGLWLWAQLDGSRHVDELLSGLSSPAQVAGLVALRRLRAHGLVVEAGRARCPDPCGDATDHAASGTLTLKGSVQDLVLDLTAPGDVCLLVATDAVTAPDGSPVRYLRRPVDAGTDPLAHLVRSVTDASWAENGALDLVATLFDQVYPK